MGILGSKKNENDLNANLIFKTIKSNVCWVYSLSLSKQGLGYQKPFYTLTP